MIYSIIVNVFFSCRVCGIQIDEMSISPKREFDPGTQSMIGLPTLPAGENLVKKRLKDGIDVATVLATHVFNVFLVGLVLNWKQLVGYHFSDVSFSPSAVAKWLVEIINKVTEIGITVMTLTMDNATSNRAI